MTDCLGNTELYYPTIGLWQMDLVEQATLNVKKAVFVGIFPCPTWILTNGGEGGAVSLTFYRWKDTGSLYLFGSRWSTTLRRNVSSIGNSIREGGNRETSPEKGNFFGFVLIKSCSLPCLQAHSIMSRYSEECHDDFTHFCWKSAICDTHQNRQLCALEPVSPASNLNF